MRKSVCGKTEPLIHVLLGSAHLIPRVTMVRRICASGKKERRRRFRLPTGMEGSRNDSSDGATGKQKTQEHNRDTGRTALQKKHALGTKETNTRNPRIRARHQNSQTHGPGKDNRARSVELLVAKNKRKNNRFCPELH